GQRRGEGKAAAPEGPVAARRAEATRSSAAVSADEEEPFLLRRQQQQRGERRKLVGHLEHDARPVRADAQALQRTVLHPLAAPATVGKSPAYAARVRDGVGRTELRDRDRLPVPPPDAQRLTGHEACGIHAALAHDVGVRPDRDWFAAPLAGLAANRRALRRNT